MVPAVEVLLIEDEETDRLLVQELVALRGRGRIRVTDARDLPTALEQLDARQFDLILLDTRLRDVSALSALRSVGESTRRIRRSCRIPPSSRPSCVRRRRGTGRGRWSFAVCSTRCGRRSATYWR